MVKMYIFCHISQILGKPVWGTNHRTPRLARQRRHHGRPCTSAAARQIQLCEFRPDKWNVPYLGQL